MLALLLKQSLAGFTALAIRFALVFVICVVAWWLLDALEPCLHKQSAWLEPPECSVTSVMERALSEGVTLPAHYIFTAIIALIVAVVWSIVRLAWQETKPGTGIRRFSLPLAFTIRYGVVLTICIGINEVVADFGRCLRNLLEGPSFVVGCYIFRPDQSPLRYNMLEHYFPPVAATCVIVAVCSLFEHRSQR